MGIRKISFRHTIAPMAAFVMVAGCVALGPQALRDTRLQYNEAVKSTTEEQLLLNIVRLRYTDTPSSLAVSTIAAQFERTQNLQITPFFTAAGSDVNRSFAAILPGAQIGAADRPTVSLTPLDDQDFTRKLFTPLTLDALLYLAKTTWPISTVFRLYLENLNWVSNAQTASGPTPKSPPDVDDFLHGIALMQLLQDRSQIVFSIEERTETVGGPLPVASVTARDVIEAVKSGFENRQDAQNGTWTLVKKTQQPVLLVDPRAVNSPEMREWARVFRLKPGMTRYEITQESQNPFAANDAEFKSIDVETRSLLQALYYVSHGIEIPAAHTAQGVVTVTRDASDQTYDWLRMTSGFFRVRSAQGESPPANAYVATRYRGYWFYIDDADQNTKSTFSLLLELSRLELASKGGAGPLLTLPLGGR